MKNGKRIYIVTGAAGFLGSTICRQLIERGERVRAFVLPNDTAKKYLSTEIEICEGDVCNKDDIRKLFVSSNNDERFVVIHCASIVTVNPEYSPKVHDVNYGGTVNIVEVCKENSQFEKLVLVSSTGCIPELQKGRLIKEVDYYSPEGLIDCYSQTKALATQTVLDAAKEGLNACVVFPSGILGPEDYAVGHTTKVLIQIIKGEMSAAIDGGFNLCDVRDLAAGTIAAVDKGGKGECYVLGNDAISFKAFSRLIAEESGCKPPHFFLPGKIAYKMAGMMEKRTKKKGGKPVMTTYAVYNLIRNNDFDSSKAKTELGYTTRPYKETIHDEIEWLKKENLI